MVAFLSFLKVKLRSLQLNEPRYERTCFLHMRSADQLLGKSAFGFVTYIEQSLFYLKPTFQAFGHLLWLYRSVYVEPGRKPEEKFSHGAAQM